MKQTKNHEIIALVARAAFANPFAMERDEIDLSVSGLSDQASNRKILEGVLESLTGALDALAPGRRLPTGVSEERARQLNLAMLFEIFHRYMDRFDEYIQRQIRTGDTPVPCGFAEQALSDLQGIGLAEERALHALAIFFQMRRAWYFVTTSIKGTSPAIRALRCRVWNNIFTASFERYADTLWNRMEQFSTLLLGETGSGKGTVAAAIGQSCYIPFLRKAGTFSESFTRAFVSTNLSEFPPSLLEAELFGYKKGAFTGAIESYDGILAQSSEWGAIFLDEIGEIPHDVQVKLLRVIESREFSPMGSRTRRRFRGRILAATNRPMSELAHGGKFRHDFFYRLCSDVIELPTLRERLRGMPNELETLLDHILSRQFGDESGTLRPSLLEALRRDLPTNYAWPGNVRELEQAVRRVFLAGSYHGTISSAEGEEATPAHSSQSREPTADEVLAAYCRRLYEKHSNWQRVSEISGLDRRTVQKYANLPSHS